MTERAWYDGPMVIRREFSRRQRPGPGDMNLHRVDAARGDDPPTVTIQMRCPACGVTSVVAGRLAGPDEAPTLLEPVRCGCDGRCGRWFRIAAGRAVPCDPPNRPATPIPDILSRLGVRRPPEVTS